MERIDMERIPRHVAIIMDGNGRWARGRLLGVKPLTLYAFSTENWNRPAEEVETLMHLIGWAIRKETPELKANNVRIRLIGEIGRLPKSVGAAPAG